MQSPANVDTPNECDKLLMEDAIRTILDAIGDDVSRDGLKDTPRRVTKMYMELTSGLREEPPEMTCFPRGTNDQMVVVSDLTYASLCEHHLIPFFGKAHIGYLPREHIVGLSKLGRLVDWYARRPQIQEELTSMIADHIMDHIKPQGVIVVIEGSHLCMSVRGVKKPGHLTITSAVRGNIPKTEFFDLLKLKG